MDERKRLFEDIDAHILSDETPSVFLQGLTSSLFEAVHPFTMLSRLRSVKQSPKYHPEGSVWNHTLMVLDEAAVRKEQASDSRVFMWAALLHDIGKAVTTKVRKGRITAYNHDIAGAELTQEFLRDFAGKPFIRAVAALVRWHMQILYTAKDMRFADLDTMREETDIRDAALLGLCDRLGRSGADKKAEIRIIENFLNKAGY